jgi:peptidoglycan/xylan/chitin deacetylase (PgdA/CDA1 family)
MRAARAVWDSAFRAAPVGLVARLTPSGLTAPCYHLVSDRPPPHVRHLYECRNVSQFKAELDWLLKRFKPVSLEDLQAASNAGKPLPERPIFFSFDDGLRECIDIVAPILRAKGVPVTFFISTGFVGNRSLCYRHKASLLVETYLQSGGARKVQTRNGEIASFDEFRRRVLQVKYADAIELDEYADQLGLHFDEYLSNERPYLDENDIASLISQGFSIGGHSVDHPRYSEIPFESQVAQTLDCLYALNARFSLPVRSFAFPFLADGVAERFMERMLSPEALDLIFYTGSVRPDHNRRVIWRFGVETRNHSFAKTWKHNVGRYQMVQVRSMLK